MDLITHQKYIINRILTSKNPLDNFNTLIQNASLERESLEYLRLQALCLGYRLKYPNLSQNLAIGGCKPHPAPLPDPCKPSRGSCYFIPVKEMSLKRYGSHIRQ